MRLRRVIAVLGASEAAVLLAHAALSYAEAPVVSFAMRRPEQQAFYAALAARIAPDGSAVARWVSGAGPTSDPRLFVALYSAPVLLASLLAIALLVVLRRAGDETDDGAARALLRWTCVFALVMAFAAPVQVADFWLSVAWGRVLWTGGNPYYAVPDWVSRGLPMEPLDMRMTYGPLWAHLSRAIVALARGSVLWSAVLFKALLAGAWIALLALVDRLMRSRPPIERCAALVIVGWLPLGVVQAVGDGHNDVLMIVGILAWLALLERGRSRWATLALALSVAIKYVSAPLFLLDLLYVAPSAPRASLVGRVRAYAPRALIAAAALALVFAPVFRSLAFFASTTEVNRGRFFVPADAVLAIGQMTGVPLLPVAALVHLAFPVVAAIAIRRYLRAPGAWSFRFAVAALLMVVLYDAAGHVWPWYLLWLLPVAALVPTTWLARWTVGVALAAPFMLLVWIAAPGASGFERFRLPSLAAYTFSLVWALWLARYVAPSPRARAARATPPASPTLAAELSARRS